MVRNRCAWSNIRNPRIARSGARVDSCETSFGQPFFDLTEAEAESIGEPNRVNDGLGGEAMTLVAGRLVFHGAQSAKTELNDNTVDSEIIQLT